MQTDFKMYLDSKFPEKFVLVNRDNKVVSAVIWYNFFFIFLVFFNS